MLRYGARNHSEGGQRVREGLGEVVNRVQNRQVSLEDLLLVPKTEATPRPTESQFQGVEGGPQESTVSETPQVIPMYRQVMTHWFKDVGSLWGSRDRRAEGRMPGKDHSSCTDTHREGKSSWVCEVSQTPWV